MEYLPPPTNNSRASTSLIRVEFAVCDQQKSCITGQILEVKLSAFNHSEVRVETAPLIVEAGGTVRLTSGNILAYDVEADNEEIGVMVERGPTHGYLVRNNVKLATGEVFSLDDLSSADIRLVMVCFIYLVLVENNSTENIKQSISQVSQFK